MKKKTRAGRSADTKEDAAARDEVRAASFPIVGIGASAGGLEAFLALLKHLPLDTGMGFVLVQHLDPEHESALTQLLGRATGLPVHEVTDNLRVERNHVYVIPPNTNLGIAEGLLTLRPRPKTRTPHRSIDGFFEALAEDQHDRAIGVILSGTATDGTLGLEAIKAEGGITFAQDDSARYDSMPRSAVAAGCVDFVLSPEAIAHEIARIAKHPAIIAAPESAARGEDDRASATTHEDDATPLPSGGRGTPPTGAEQARAEARRDATERVPPRADNGFKKILLLLRNHAGVDFSLYKSSTIRRRITRRMVLSKQNTLEDYAQFLRGNTKELDALYSDVLISVTSFFRNPDAFDMLQRSVFPQLMKQRSDEPLRVWVLGCSTGQEAYSIAMAFVEAADKAPRMRTLQIFATDLNDALLEKARDGLYAKSLVHDLSPERLRRFFVEEEGGYRVTKALRDMVVFARQNVISDPPFSRMDIISCRNLLIYLDIDLQRKIFPVFHFALKPGGFLYLGASESIAGFTDLFEPVDKKQKIYAKKTAPTPAFHLPTQHEGERPARGSRQRGPLRMPVAAERGTDAVRGELSSQREADRIAVQQFAPPGVLINADLQILQFRGATAAYLKPPSGKASFDILKMARNGLMLPLRTAITKAKQENKTARKERVRVEDDGKTRTVNLEVIPLKNLRERCFLVVFEDSKGAARPPSGSQAKRGRLVPSNRRSPIGDNARRITELESELAETRDYLQSIQEQHEAANEELQASNEEVQSANEELQSINEELETSKEELESANEELTTVNEEMGNRNADLGRLNSDLVNVQTSTQQAIVLLDRNLTIRRFSVQAEKQFDLLAADVGRSFSSVRHHLVDVPDLAAFLMEVIDSVQAREREVQDTDGHWFSLRVRPYLTLDNKVDGAVLVLVDINDLKRTEQAITAARNYAQNIVATVREPLVVLSGDLRVESANRAFYDTFRVTPAETVGTLVYDLGNRQWDVPDLRTLLERILPERETIHDFAVEHTFEHLGRRTMLLNARRMHDPEHGVPLILLAFEDVTEWKQAGEALARLAAIVESSRDAIISTDLNGIVASWNRAAERLYGYTAQEALGQPVTLILPQDRFDEETDILERVRRGTTVDHAETVRRRKDGTPLHVSVTVSPIRDSRGEIVGASKISHDITERKQAEENLRDSEHRFARFMHHLPGLAWIKDSDGRYVYANEAAELAFRVSRGELYGRSDEEIFPPETAAVFRLNDRQALESDSSVQTIEALEHADGIVHQSVVSKFAIPGAHGRATMVGGVAIDITELKEAEEALRRSEERLHLSQQVAKVGSFDWNVETGVNIWTPALEALYGLAPGEFAKTQSSWEALVHPDDRADALAAVARTLATGQTEEQEWRVVWPDGSVHWVAGRFQCIQDGSGKPLRVTGVNLDITEIKKAEEALRRSETRFRVLADASPGLIWRLDPDGRSTYVNRQYLEYFDKSAEEVLGDGWHPLLHPDDAPDYIAAVADSQRARDRLQATVRVKDKHDRWRWVESHALPLFGENQEYLGHVGFSLDITERQQHEEALFEADRHKNEFLAMLAHELRNPLAPILVSIEIVRRAQTLTEADAVDLSPRVDHALEVMQRQVGQMVRLVDDLLDAGRISRGKIDLRRERVEVASVIHHAVEASRPLTERRSQTLTVVLPTDSVYVNADPTRLAQIVGNLLNNACKFTERGGHIWLEVEREDPQSDGTGVAPNDIAPQLVIRVRDTGIGIAPDRLDGIFEMFTQLDTSLERSSTGLGIGLTLVKTLVEMHGGSVQASSPGIGHGSEFVIRLPSVVEAATQTPQPPPTEPAVTPLRILIVDDNRDSADMLATLLTFSGHETHTAHDGMAAVEAATELDPDVIFLDIGLPGLNGYEAARRIRERNGGRRRPVLVALTGWGQDEDRRRSEEAGFDAHVVKPVDDVRLRKLLADVGSRNQKVER